MFGGKILELTGTTAFIRMCVCVRVWVGVGVGVGVVCLCVWCVCVSGVSVCLCLSVFLYSTSVGAESLYCTSAFMHKKTLREIVYILLYCTVL